MRLEGRHFALFFAVSSCTSPLRMVLGVHVLSRVFPFVFCTLTSTVVAHASVAEIDVSNLALAFPGPTFVQEPSIRRVVSARKTAVVSPGS